jgi:predicted metal-dependent enzyme (double-stranded beta helix superfamily)
MQTETRPAAGSYTLARYVADVTQTMDRQLALDETVKEIALLKRRLVSSGAPIPAEYLVRHPTAPYTRNLVHYDPAGRFTVIALVWGPFQETAVHDHYNWCCVGVAQGLAHVTNYDRLDDESAEGRAELRIASSVLQPTGAVAALLPPSRTNIHKMANASRATMVSIHTYGDPGTRAVAYNVKEGTYAPIDLRFHNLEP